MSGFEDIKLKSMIEISKKDGIYLQVSKNLRFTKIKIEKGMMYIYKECNYYRSEPGWELCKQVTCSPNSKRYCDPADFSIYINEQLKDLK